MRAETRHGRTMKTCTLKRGMLHVETPLGIINIRVGLRDSAGRRVEAVEMLPNLYAGEPKVHAHGYRFVEELNNGEKS